MKRKLKRQGYLTREDLIRLGRWKSRRAARHYADGHNDDLTVREITRFCLSAGSEKARKEGVRVCVVTGAAVAMRLCGEGGMAPAVKAEGGPPLKDGG